MKQKDKDRLVQTYLTAEQYDDLTAYCAVVGLGHGTVIELALNEFLSVHHARFSSAKVVYNCDREDCEEPTKQKVGSRDKIGLYRCERQDCPVRKNNIVER